MDESDEAFEARAAAEWKRISESPRIREFPCLGGWAILAMPLDAFPYRGMAAMFMGFTAGFKPDDFIDLQARRNLDDDAPERTFWVFALSPDVVRRWKRRSRRWARRRAAKR